MIRFVTFTFIIILLVGGCQRDIISFDEALGAMDRPTAVFSPESIALFFPRIRWFKYLIRVEKGLQYHQLADLIRENYSVKKGPSLLKRCGDECSKCYSGDEREAFISLSCWTRDRSPFFIRESKDVDYLKGSILSGKLYFSVPESQLFGGESYSRWEGSCSPATKLIDSNESGVCFQGLSGYRVKIDTPNLTNEIDSIWAVRVWFREKKGDRELSRRLDGAVIRVVNRSGEFIDREILFILNRTVFIEGFSLSYCGDISPAFTACCGEFTVRMSDGSYRCSFIPRDFGNGARCPKILSETTVETTFFIITCRPV